MTSGLLRWGRQSWLVQPPAAAQVRGAEQHHNAGHQPDDRAPRKRAAQLTRPHDHLHVVAHAVHEVQVPGAVQGQRPSPETPRDGTEMNVAPDQDGWATVSWTVPDVPVVGGIIGQPYQRDETPRLIAVDAVSW